jgi:hypothetical protein
MNVLVLTPDAVGSTLLQRILTIYMQFHEFGKPVINIHELTNGLEKIYSSEFNREMVVKNFDIGGSQKLSTITELLKAADHYMVCRLALYHINSRKDRLEEQIPFYQFLDDNYFVICARRRNIFEYGLSHAINRVTKKLNVYYKDEKLDIFWKLYQDGITVPMDSLESIWNRYVEYLDWSERHFSIGSYYYYEDHVDNLENYILNLPVFAGQPKRIGWKETFGMAFKDWNRCHYLNSNVGNLLSHSKTVQEQITYSTKQDKSAIIIQENNFELAVAKDFVEQNMSKYNEVNDSIHLMTKLGIMTSSVPIKKQTMAEKMHIVKNFDQCLDFYNEWILQYPHIGKPMTKDDLQTSMQAELKKWFNPDSGTELIPVN